MARLDESIANLEDISEQIADISGNSNSWNGDLNRLFRDSTFDECLNQIVVISLLKKFKKTACPEVLNALIGQGSESVSHRNAFHHVFRKQHENGFNELQVNLRKLLESDAIAKGASLAAY